jgi:Spy/CpxP family protein refolding chaperone
MTESSIVRTMTKVVTLASLTGAMALGGAGIAMAQTAQPSAQPGPDASTRHHPHRQGLVAQALRLDSLSPEQRAAIEQLAGTRRTAEIPVRQANARILSALATQVEQASIDPQALAPSIQARDGAAVQAGAIERDTLQKLHDLLTPAQRGQLVSAVEAKLQPGAWGHDGGAARGGLAHMERELGLTAAQEQQIASNLQHAVPGQAAGARAARLAAGKAWLESFRSDTFNASAGNLDMLGRMVRRSEHLENLVQAAAPVLSPAQRAQLANHLRQRAAHEARS